MTPSWSSMVRIFGRIGLLSFGGPAAQIALMHETLVTRHKLLKEQEYLSALSLCMLLPGPEAMQLATYAGWRLRGVPGGLLAGLLFVVPGALVILALAFGYIAYGAAPLLQAAFIGIKATVIVIVVQALLRVGKKALTGRDAVALAVLAFVAIFALGLPFPLIVLAAGLYGYATAAKSAPPAATERPQGTLRTICIWVTLWVGPILLVWISNERFLTEIALFFSRLAVVTFGGAYAVLAYMTQEVVETQGWLTTGQMIDALGLAETTPGPLILVTEFVALLAGFAQGGVLLALAAGLLTLWVTFTPCFLWIFAAGPYLDHIAGRPRLAAALQAITAAVVGVIANLSVWFALHVLFRDVTRMGALPVPELTSFDPVAALFTLLAALCMLVLKRSLIVTLALLACAGGVLGLVGLI
ncbi:MAG: chromate efflux transporter [Pseudomonadota bacterium]